MRFKKITAAVLLCGMLLSSAVSCSDTAGNDPVEDVKTTVQEITEPEVTTEPRDRPAVEKADFGGEEFNIAYPNWSLYRTLYFSEGENGDQVNDAIYARTRKIEENLGVKMIQSECGYVNEMFGRVSKVILSGEDLYDLLLTHCSDSLPAFVSSGCIMNWNDIPGIDMSKDFWNQSVRENFELNGVLAFAANSYILPDVNTLFYSMELADSFGIASVYDRVLDGSWTWDELIADSDKVKGDIDGDGQMTEKDRYGFMGECGWQFASIGTSCDLYIVRKNEEGSLEVTLNSEKTANIVDKLKKFINETESVFTWQYDLKYDPNAGGMPPVGFDKGNALYYLVPLSLAPEFRNKEFDFGIIPLPKYDEAQKDYTTLNWAGFMCVPRSVQNLEMTAAVCEQLAYQNEEYVVPAFYDVLLGQKIARDEKSIEMLDIIFRNSVYDLGLSLGWYMAIPDVLAKNGKPFASYYEKKIKGWNKEIEKYEKVYAEFSDE